MEHGSLRRYGDKWTLMWKDSRGKRHQKIFGNANTVPESDAREAVDGFLRELQEYGDPVELEKIRWPSGVRTRVGHNEACVFCGADTHKRLLGYAACGPCGDRKRNWDFQACLECGRKFPIIRDPMNERATISRCPDCKAVFDLCR